MRTVCVTTRCACNFSSLAAVVVVACLLLFYDCTSCLSIPAGWQEAREEARSPSPRVSCRRAARAMMMMTRVPSLALSLPGWECPAGTRPGDVFPGERTRDQPPIHKKKKKKKSPKRRAGRLYKAQVAPRSLQGNGGSNQARRRKAKRRRPALDGKAPKVPSKQLPPLLPTTISDEETCLGTKPATTAGGREGARGVPSAQAATSFPPEGDPEVPVSVGLPGAMVQLPVCALDCEGLRRLLLSGGGGGGASSSSPSSSSSSCLVLDCRSFFAFNASHIVGACNVRLSTLVRRRAKGAPGLEHLLPDEEVRARLRQGRYPAVVVLDERSADLEAPKRDSTLRLALGTLGREARHARLCFLKGGYDAFSSIYPELCTKPSAPKGLTLPLSTHNMPGSADSNCSSCGTPLYDQGGPVEILPFLYLGSAYHASRKDMLDALGITALINVSANCPNHFEGHYQYKSIPVEDNHKADISCWFNEAIDFIDSVKNDGGRVFVHCQAGISRSATICLAYLMRTNRVKLDEAFEFVKQRRSIISPNFSFMGQLLQFESQVLAPNCSAEAGSPAMSALDRGTSTTTVFNFPVSIPVHPSSSALSYLQSPITTSPSC